MQAILMNFGDNTRVVNDSHNSAVSIGIGQLVECDIHDVHYHMIRRSVASETLMVVPKDVKPSPRLSMIMTLLKGIETEPYDELLDEFNKVVPPEGEDINIRPNRTQMRLCLRDAARIEVAHALRLQSKVIIHEQGDAVTRKEVPRPPAPKVVEPDKAPQKKAAARSSAIKSSKPVRKRERL